MLQYSMFQISVLKTSNNDVHVICHAPNRVLKHNFSFFFLVQVKKLFAHKDGRPLQVYERLLAGSTAGVIAQTAIYPMEVLYVTKQFCLLSACVAMQLYYAGHAGFWLDLQIFSTRGK